MRLSLRLKLFALALTIAVAFLILIVSSTLISQRVNREINSIQQRYLPKIELGPKLERSFEMLRRAVQDATVAEDMEALEETHALKDNFIAQLTSAGTVITNSDAAALKRVVQEYHSSAYKISRRIIHGETGEDLVTDISAMQIRQTHAEEVIVKLTRFDKKQLAEAFSAVARFQQSAKNVRLYISLACLFFVIVLSLWLSSGVLKSISTLTSGFRRFGQGNFSERIPILVRDELGEVAEQANQMADNLQRLAEERERLAWIKAGNSALAYELLGELEPHEVAQRALEVVAKHFDAPAAALYVVRDQENLQLLGHYAGTDMKELKAVSEFRMGEGLVGQTALEEEIVVLKDAPLDYLRVRSGLGESSSRTIVLVPLSRSQKKMGVLEVALFKPWSELLKEGLLSIREILVIALEAAHARTAMRELLLETQTLARRLSTQEEELRATNEELQAQQEELRATNEELTQQAEELEAQRTSLEEKNTELHSVQQTLEKKAEELASVSAYKSQFLANMSHELRTPLNSMLLLSNLLADNDDRNLTNKQVEFCQTIHAAGKDLLALINQVLDLAKIESGKQNVTIESVVLGEVVDQAQRVFEPLAREKGLKLVVEKEKNLPEQIHTDRQRVVQILNNLLGNAIKFTHQGQVSLRMGRPRSDQPFTCKDIKPEEAIALVVSDTGVGIDPQHQKRIFSPFEQVEGASDRRYGGTGLGLSIARELAQLLGGELELQSTPGKGSTFFCYLPQAGPAQRSVSKTDIAAASVVAMEKTPASAPLVSRGEDQLLIIEDDAAFAQALGEVIEAQGLKYLIAHDGTNGIKLAKAHRPKGIILDLMLPDINGRAVMDQLRLDSATATIPIHIVSALDSGDYGGSTGTVGYLTKPATRTDLISVIESLAPKSTKKQGRILVVEQEVSPKDSLIPRLQAEGLNAEQVTSASEILQVLKTGEFACLIVDLALSDVDGLKFLQSLQQDGQPLPPIIVYTSRALSKEEARRLEAYAEAVVLKEGASVERLLGEIRLFVRRLKEGRSSKLTPLAFPLPHELRLENKKILVADDDMRTAYALSALLRAKGAEVLMADTGRVALEMLEKHPNLDAVLMDMMMPEMDGYEAMRRIREKERWRELPIVALTAKAMADDKNKCLEAGASSYIPKPVDAGRLLAMLEGYLNGNKKDGTPPGR